MLTVIIPTRDDEDRLARMLPGLVRHAVSGAIVEVIVVDRGSTDETVRVAQVAGCTLVDAGAVDVPALAAMARGGWLLVLQAGARPVGDWLDSVRAHLDGRAPAGAARFRLARDPGVPWWRRLAPVGGAGGPFGRGFLISRGQAAALGRPGMALADLPRGVAARTLPAALIPPSA